MPSNWERWREYTSGLSSPDNFVNWSFLYLISASLQRRVWMGSDVFPNMYVILVGAPGIGKGLCIKEVSKFLKYWKKTDAIKLNGEKLDETEKLVAENMVEADVKRAQEFEMQGRAKGADIAPPLLIPIAADATTYEALVKAMAESYSRVMIPVWSDKSQKMIVRPHGHSSLAFCLLELSSLLRKRTNDTVSYMLGLYDCPEDYEYITKTQGKDRVRRGCLNVLAGTTPSFMSSTFDDKLMDEGWSSRTFYIFATKNRKNQFWIPPISEEQEKCKKDILGHIRQLSNLYGQVQIDSETAIFLQEWWNDFENNKSKRTNKSAKLIPYYSRMNLHVQKLALAHHFGETTDMHVPKSEFEWAIQFLEDEAKNMHLALMMEGDNPIAKVTKKVLELLALGKKSIVDLMVDTHHLTNQAGLEEALSYLKDTDQITSTMEEDKEMESKVVVYKLKG